MPPLPKPVTPELKQQLQVTLRALCCTSDMLADGEAGAQGAEWERVISAGLLPDDWRPLNAEATPGYETLPLRTRGYPPRGLFPAMCPPCYDDGALELCSHPQMLALHAELMGTTTDRVRFVRLALTAWLLPCRLSRLSERALRPGPLVAAEPRGGQPRPALAQPFPHRRRRPRPDAAVHRPAAGPYAYLPAGLGGRGRGGGRATVAGAGCSPAAGGGSVAAGQQSPALRRLRRQRARGVGVVPRAAAPADGGAVAGGAAGAAAGQPRQLHPPHAPRRTPLPCPNHHIPTSILQPPS